MHNVARLLTPRNDRETNGSTEKKTRNDKKNQPNTSHKARHGLSNQKKNIAKQNKSAHDVKPRQRERTINQPHMHVRVYHGGVRGQRDDKKQIFLFIVLCFMLLSFGAAATATVTAPFRKTTTIPPHVVAVVVLVGGGAESGASRTQELHPFALARGIIPWLPHTVHHLRASHCIFFLFSLLCSFHCTPPAPARKERVCECAENYLPSCFVRSPP